jgi:hypothetical protein
VIGPSTTLTDVAFAVCTALERAGYCVVLTGGSAATRPAGASGQSERVAMCAGALADEGAKNLVCSMTSRRSGSMYWRVGRECMECVRDPYPLRLAMT